MTLGTRELSERVEGPDFQGNFINGVDAKGRVSIPAAYRDIIYDRSHERRVVLMPHRGTMDCIVGHDTSFMKEIARAQTERYSADDVSEEAERARMRAFGLTHNLPYEEAGRIILHEDLRDYAEIEDKALFFAVGKGFQIWNPELFIEGIKDSEPKVARMIQRKLDRAVKK
ncbi:MAG: hypothetical protein WA906_08330 [Pacificimonas sp.]